MKKVILSMALAGSFALGYAQDALSPYHSIVAQDGSGNYTSIQDAVNAAPENRNRPWRIFVKNGSYREQIVVPKNKNVCSSDRPE